MSSATTLTMPRTAPGEARIRARSNGLDVIVGSCVRSVRRWRATVWSRAGQHTAGDEIVFGDSLKQLRELLEERIARDGPWWQVTTPSASGRRTKETKR